MVRTTKKRILVLSAALTVFATLSLSAQAPASNAAPPEAVEQPNASSQAATPPPAPQAPARTPVASDVMFGTAFKALKKYGFYSRRIDPQVTAALNGLRAIDPALHCARYYGYFMLYHDSKEKIRLNTPTNDDPIAWAILMAKAINAAKRLSSKLQATDDDSLYQFIFQTMLARTDPYARYLNPTEVPAYQGAQQIAQAVQAPAQQALPQTQQPTEEAAATAEAAPEPFGIQLAGGGTLTQHDDNNLLMTLPAIEPGLTDSIRAAFKTLSEDKEAPKFKQIILNLSECDGGDLNEAAGVADLFLNQGVIASTLGPSNESQHTFRATKNAVYSGPLAVLISNKTSSSAEMLAAAMQDHKRATILGQRSLGKGTVQRMFNLPNGGALLLTWAQLVRPNGRHIHKYGVEPDNTTS